jgi:hypothetical protein
MVRTTADYLAEAEAAAEKGKPGTKPDDFLN